MVLIFFGTDFNVNKILLQASGCLINTIHFDGGGCCFRRNVKERKSVTWRNWRCCDLQLLLWQQRVRGQET